MPAQATMVKQLVCCVNRGIIQSGTSTVGFDAADELSSSMLPSTKACSHVCCPLVVALLVNYQSHDTSNPTVASTWYVALELVQTISPHMVTIQPNSLLSTWYVALLVTISFNGTLSPTSSLVVATAGQHHPQ
ncbi:Hypothetical predicted protein [Mytilus galloprovincialis]|uniref:Uncharacterized protein n=1 Tax=Mytilus galloprovincialis TaxID=29158 RepID=A0A8B6D8J5_MYTGA|nr:Hypothetical predicted protein [Mytilus galloprovincialis]